MNAVATIDQAVALAIPDDCAFDDWVALGRDLFTRHRQVEWLLADWLRIGSERFEGEEQLAMFLDEIGVDTRRAIADAKVAALIPPEWRSDRVSFNVCKQIAQIDDESTRQRMLKLAVEEHWNERKARNRVIEHRCETGQLLPDEDSTSRLATEIVRSWNRAGPDARSYFYELAEIAARKGFAPIDENTAE